MEEDDVIWMDIDPDPIVPVPPQCPDPPTSSKKTDIAKYSERLAASSRFANQIILNRDKNELRHRPWFRSLPIRNVILTMYTALSSSEEMKPFQLLGLGETLLQFLKKLAGNSGSEDQQVLENNFGVTHKRRENDRDLDKYLTILENIFVQLKRYENDDEVQKDSKKFLDTVWKLHASGAIDLSRTTIPGAMVHSSPSRLKTALATCIGPQIEDQDLQNSSSLALVPLCDRNPDNFLKVMQSLRVKYLDNSSGVDKKKQILDLGSKLQTDLMLRLGHGVRYASLFPTQFHPLLIFLSQILSTHSSKNLMQNEIVKKEIRNLLDKLSHQCELDRFNCSDVIFILATNPNVPRDIIFSNEIPRPPKIRNSHGLWLRRCLRNSDLIIPITVN